MQAHGGGHGPLDGAAAPLPGVFPAVSIGSLVPEKEESLRWECLHPMNGKGDTGHAPSTSQRLFYLILHLAEDKYYIIIIPIF